MSVELNQSDMYYEEEDNAPMSYNNLQLQQRATREFVPTDKKDDKYWFKRVRNNASARKSRLKRKALDKVIQKKLMALENENRQLKNELAAMNIMRSVGRRSEDWSAQEEKNNQEDTVDDNSREPEHDEDGGCSSAGSSRSEADDYRNDSPPMTGPSLLSMYQSIYGQSDLSLFDPTGRGLQHPHSFLPFHVHPHAMMAFVPYINERKFGLEPNMETDRDESEVKSVPHKIRIKERLHSAFRQHT